ncbi:MAG: ABC transporter ATP-binding protein [Rhizobiaceae bacterium]
MTLLSIEGVSKRYGPVTALDGVHLEVPAGSRTAIVGPSGSGKSTLLRIVAGFETADAGTVTLDDETLCDGLYSTPAHRRQIGIVSQDGALFPHLSVRDNIGFGLNGDARDHNRRIQELLGIVELDAGMAERRPHQLSGGQQQRVALARALARKPKLMLLDEPFSALDAGLREHMRRAVARLLAEANITTVLVTHDQAEALSFADQVAVLRDGRLVQAGTPQDLYFRPKDQQTALFLGEAVVLDADIDDDAAECVLGRIALDAAHASGPAKIMIRPEQFSMSDAKSEKIGSVGCPGQITYVEFGGPAWTVAVSVAGGPPLTVKVNSALAPKIGDRVRIDVTGKAHVLAG